MPPSRSPRLLPAFVLGALTAFAVGTLAVLPTGCAKKPLPVVKADPSEVEYAGCYEVQRDGPVCLIATKAESRKLSLHPVWPAERFEVWSGDKVLPTTRVEGAAGPIFQLTVPAGASGLELRSLGPRGSRAWSLKIADWPKLPEWLEKAWDLFGQGTAQYEAARALIDREIEHCSDPGFRAVAWKLRAFLQPREPDPDLRISAFQRAIAEYHRIGYVQGEVQVAAVLIFELIQKHDFGRARATLQDIQLPGGHPWEAAYKVAYSQGLLAKYIGDFRTATGAFDAAADLAGEVGMEKQRRSAQQEEAAMMSQLGRFIESDDLLARLTADSKAGADPCGRATLLTNRGWTRYLGRDAGDWRLGDPIDPFTQARNIYRKTKDCRDQAREEFNASINLALALLQANRAEEAGAIIAEAAPEAADGSALDRMWWLDLRARLALKQRRTGNALRLYAQLERAARATLSPENQWRAAFGKARVFAALGRLDQAAASLAEAEGLVDQQLNRVPLSEGRESFSDQWSAGSRLYVEVLLKTGQVEQALQVARRARGRVLHQLAESARVESLSTEQRKARDAWLGSYWKLRNELDQISNESWQQPKNRAGEVRADLERRLRDTQEALDRVLSGLGGSKTSPAPPLRRPTAGELLLAYFPLSAERRWVAFCDDGRAVLAKEFEMPGGSLRSSGVEASLAGALLEPFASEIRAARRLVVLPYGILKTVDFQALPFGGGDQVLLSDRPVVYGLDLPDRPLGAASGAPKAVVVADSRGDLPEAREEGLETAASLRGLAPRWTVSLLQGKAATAEAVRAAILGGVDLLHYAGHADFSGRGGWESQIPLAEQGRLTLGDILTLNRQPRWVILSGCETGASDDSAQVETQGLAHAFLLGGSEAVVAASRKVNDKVARELVLEMYRHMGSTPDLAVLLQKAQQALRQRGVSQREWASFRVFEP